MNYQLKTKLDYLMIASFIYLFIPVFLFLVFWIKLPYTVVALILLSIFFIRQGKKCFTKNNKNKLLKNRKDVIILIVTMIILFLWLLCSGSGGFLYQNGDYNKHNALLHDLISYDWPVSYPNYGNLVYYFAYHLPAAAVGKILGFRAANIFLFLWTYIGLIIGVLWIFRLLKKVSIIPVVLMILFGGMDFFGYVLLNEKIPVLGKHIEWWVGSKILQLSSLTTLLFWVPHMFIPALIISPILLYFYNNYQNNPIIYILLVCCFFWSPFVLIGFIPFFIALFIRYFKNFIKKKEKFIDWSNLLLCGFISLILILFITSNNGYNDIKGFLWNFVDMKIFWPKLLLFYFLEFGIVALFIHHYKIKNLNYNYFFIAIITMLIFNLIHMGEWNDFAMRSTIPSLIILFIYFVMTINKLCQNYKANFKPLIVALLLIILCSGSSIYEISRPFIKDSKLTDNWKTLISGKNRLKNQYISPTDALFDKYIKK